MHKFLRLGLATAAAVVLATSCSKSNNAGTGSSSIPLPTIPGPASVPGPSTTKAGPGPKPGRPASCDLSDQLSYAILDASTKAATVGPQEKAALVDRLDKAAAALKSALPQYGTQIDANTANAKALMDGKPSDTAPPGNDFDTWYKQNCIA